MINKFALLRRKLLSEAFLQPYFMMDQRPVHKGDMLYIKGGMRVVEFKVVETDPAPFCIVTANTLIQCNKEEAIKLEVKEISKLLYRTKAHDGFAGGREAECCWL